MKAIKYILLSLVLAATASCQELRKVKMTVTEEDGTVIQDAEVRIYFLSYDAGKDEEVIGKTDAGGVFAAMGRPTLRMSARAKKPGYYETDMGRLSRKQDHDLTLVLRKKKNPIPLFAKRFRGIVPSIGNAHGYDFEIGDWVAPHGKGKQADILFKVDLLQGKDNKPTGKLTISFPSENEGCSEVNTGNGYLPLSEMLMPNEAFRDNYLSEMVRYESGYQNENKKKKTSYFLRTRVREIKKNVHTYNYSKLKNGVDFMMSGGVFLEGVSREKHPNEMGIVTFTYYYNPTHNDRNLEFDPKQNLFKGLGTKERVNQP